MIASFKIIIFIGDKLGVSIALIYYNMRILFFIVFESNSDKMHGKGSTLG